mmetsp:Transcript_70315/g.63114  ORF Transcript_70315/g.63114 Transcript_70315/m.63114 type:complete len:155 (-) Transcript_70315:111-575(-)
MYGYSERIYCNPKGYPPPRCKLEERAEDITLDEVHKHNKRNDFWVTFNGSVYDITKMISRKPKLKSKLLFAGGQDLEPLYNLFKSHYIKKEIPFIRNCRIGHLGKKDKQVQMKENEDIKESIKKKSISEYSMWKNHFSFADQFGSIKRYNDFKV